MATEGECVVVADLVAVVEVVVGVVVEGEVEVGVVVVGGVASEGVVGVVLEGGAASGVGAGALFPAWTVTASFIPWLQWPGVAQMK